PAGRLLVTASDRTDVNHRGGGIGAGLTAGIGAVAVVTKVDNTVRAYVEESDVTVSEAADILASAERNLAAIAATGGMGLTAGIGGTAVVTLIGGEADSDLMSELDHDGNGTLTTVTAFSSGDALAEGDTFDAEAAGLTADDLARLEAAKIDAAGGVERAPVGSTSARLVASDVVSGGTVGI